MMRNLIKRIRYLFRPTIVRMYQDVWKQDRDYIRNMRMRVNPCDLEVHGNPILVRR